MKKQKRILKIIITLTTLIMLLTPMISFATDETEETTIIIHTNTNTDVYNLGANVKVTVGWESHTGSLTSYSDVQAIGFTLQYDESKLEFVDATFNEVAEDSTIQERPLEEDFYNAETPGTLVLSKVSLNDLDISSINLNFKTTAIGEAIIKLTEVECVADGNLVSPDVVEYSTNGEVTITTVAFGDVNSDGEINSADTILIRRYLAGEIELTELELENADVNLDNIVDDLDVKLILEYIVGNVTSLPIKYGDVDCDGYVTASDAPLVLQYCAEMEGIELSAQALANADVNGDGIVNEIDADIILLYVAQLCQMPYRMITNLDLKALDKEDFHIVTGFSLKNMKVEELIKNFNTDKEFEVCNNKDIILENDDIFGTGTKVKFKKNAREDLAEYNVVIYGDTTGDGKINAIDALALIKHLNNVIPLENEVFIEAGRILCEDGANPTAVDALAIIKHANKKQLISQTK